jgi:hypothetical protein
MSHSVKFSSFTKENKDRQGKYYKESKKRILEESNPRLLAARARSSSSSHTLTSFTSYASVSHYKKAVLLESLHKALSQEPESDDDYEVFPEDKAERSRLVEELASLNREETEIAAAMKRSLSVSKKPSQLNREETEIAAAMKRSLSVSKKPSQLNREETEIAAAMKRSLSISEEDEALHTALHLSLKKSPHISEEEEEYRSALFISSQSSRELEKLDLQGLGTWEKLGWIRKTSAKEKESCDEEYTGGSRRIGNMQLVSPSGEYITVIMVCSVISIYENAVKEQGEDFMISQEITNPWKLFIRMCKFGWWRDLLPGEMPQIQHIRRMASLIGCAIRVITEGKIHERGVGDKKHTVIRETEQIEGNGNLAFTIRLCENHYWNSGDGEKYSYK